MCVNLPNSALGSLRNALASNLQGQVPLLIPCLKIAQEVHSPKA